LVESPLNIGANAGNTALREVYDNLKQESVAHLYYLPGDDQLAGEENGTVDGVHPTDLGFYRMAVTYRPVLEKILRTDGALTRPLVKHVAILLVVFAGGPKSANRRSGSALLRRDECERRWNGKMMKDLWVEPSSAV
jgi:hypothetical protein